ncbi:MAG: pre-peptidase C-terminal domain-containing protein, partial [Chloroflexota bacterium]
TETLPDAVPIPFNIRIHENFDAIGDVYDVYTFTLGDTRAVRIHLDVPHDSDQDLILYDGNKNVLGVSQNLGVQDEGINLTLGAGQYYVFVARVAPPPSLEPTDSNYGLLVSIE